MSARTKPLLVRAGSVSITIYSRSRRIRGRSYSEHSIHWREPDGKARKKAFGSLEKAKEFAGTVARGLSQGEAEAKRATPEDLAAYGAAVELLRPLGVSLLQAASEYASARKKLPPEVSLTDIVTAYLRLAPPRNGSKEGAGYSQGVCR